MRHADFATLYRSTVGFDRFAQVLDAVGGHETSYPPYNIERTGDNQYRITMAVAGFAQSDLRIEVKETALTVHGEKSASDGERQFLHRGIGARTFERRFQLADYVEVTGAELKDGMLHVDLVRNVPERMKPRSIPIATPVATVDPQLPAPAVN
jgi:molecular chaperone IbpA